MCGFGVEEKHDDMDDVCEQYNKDIPTACKKKLIERDWVLFGRVKRRIQGVTACMKFGFY